MADPGRLLFLDFETYYDDEYSLRSMPTPNYILDPRFETQIVAVKDGLDAPSRIVDGRDFPQFISQYDPNVTVTVTFNALFDNSILAWRYGFVPRQMLDAMGMARALRGHILARASLEYVSEALGLGQKGDALTHVKGMRRDQIPQELFDQFCAYAVQDNELCAGIYRLLSPEFPEHERRIMDLVLRCAVLPKFKLDIPLATSHLQQVKAEKAALLESAAASRVDLMSADKFKLLLEQCGVTVPTKISPTGKEIPALARKDTFMADLAEHPDPRVQALAAARLGHKSTLEETRCEKLLSIAMLPWGNNSGTVPVPLRYGGAHTHRLSGEWKMNMQNLPTFRGSKGKSKLRHSLIVNDDEVVVVADLGQIEARINAYISGEDLLIKQFREKLDPYAKMAERIFGYEVDRKVQIGEGFIGKTAILGLGYQCGVKKFNTMVLTQARDMGLDLGNKWNDNVARKAVNTYRDTYTRIVASWGRLHHIVGTAWLGTSAPVRFGPVAIGHGYVELPGGMKLQYAEPKEDGDQYTYKYGRKPHYLYGGKLLEHIVQTLARIVVMNAALRLNHLGYRFVLQAHDELVFIVKRTDLDNAKKIIHAEMVRPPSWAPDIPLTADVGHGNSYGEAK